MTGVMVLIVVGAAAAGVSWWGAGMVRRLALERGLVAAANARSMHATPTPYGGGWGVLAGLVPLWAVFALIEGRPDVLVALAVAGVLVAVSWHDDRHGVGALPRLVVQVLVVTAGLAVLPGEGLVFGGLVPWWADRLLTLVFWVWFVNLYNFMDGIDGMATVETLALALGLTAAAYLVDAGFGPAYPVALAGAILGFGLLNWHPARIFLGDVGSIPLGYLIGFLLILLAVNGHLAAALILPAYYIADATVTLLRRLAAGLPPWVAHRDHYYQRAARALKRHDRVCRLVARLNAALVLLAIIALGLGARGQIVAVALSYGLAGAVLVAFRAIGNREAAAGREDSGAAA